MSVCASRPFVCRSALVATALFLISIAASAQSVSITSPAPNSTSPSAVLITSSTTGWNSNDHLEVWDSVPGLSATKLGNVFSASESVIYVLPSGSHTTTVNLVDNTGKILAGNSVTYNVAESCSNSSTALCNMDQLGIDNTQNDCNPPIEDLWVANPCGGGVQGGGSDPTSTSITAVTESSPYSDTGNTLNGQSLHLSEQQGSGGYSNVLFKANAPNSDWTTQTQSNWIVDAYVYLPNPNAHQAFEIDAQYVSNNGVWTKFYTECAFNQSNGTGFWEVYGGPNYPWVNLNGITVTINNKQVTPPKVPCNRSQFTQPWSGGPSTSGWHHIVWTFKRNSDANGDGYPTFVSLQFDNQKTTLNFTPTTQNSGTGEGDKGDFAALVQLDGVSNPNPPNNYPTVDAYINEFNIIHTP